GRRSRATSSTHRWPPDLTEVRAAGAPNHLGRQLRDEAVVVALLLELPGAKVHRAAELADDDARAERIERNAEAGVVLDVSESLRRRADARRAVLRDED